MGEDCRSWLPQQHFNWQLQNWNSLTALQGLGQSNAVTAHMNPGTNMVYTHGNCPVRAVTQLPNHLPMGQANEPHGWFYGLPQFRQAFTPVTISTVEERVPEAVPTNMGSGSVEKRFLVFDQSGDQTTLVFGSDTRQPMQFPTWIKQFPGVPGEYKLNGEISGYKSGINHPLGPMLDDKANENHDSDQVSEMHEDTEELNALLYSDDESGYTEDEVTSTGHSPGSMTDHGNKPDWLEGSTEDVASCNMPTRKRKVSDDKDADIQSLEDTASSGDPNRTTEYEDDAESSCAEMDYSSKNKRMRREKLKETISLLQRIVPSRKGKDATVVLDEAIQYLKSLKLKAKALGLGTL